MKPRDWYAEQRPVADEHPVTQQAEALLKEEHPVLERRLRALYRELYETLDPQGNGIWIELEALLNERSLLSAIAYYNLGVEAGLAMAPTCPSNPVAEGQPKGMPPKPTWYACDPNCPGWGVFNEQGEIQRCDACGRFADDDEAIEHVTRLMQREGASQKACIKCGVVLQAPELQGDERCAGCGDPA